jgi:hypothetical protein
MNDMLFRLLDTDPIALTEAYYAESPELQAVDNCIKQMGELVKKQPRVNLAGTEYNRQLQDAVAKLFNCKAVYIDWHRMMHLFSAYTYIPWDIDPALYSSSEMKMRTETVETSSGIRYKHKLNTLFITMSNSLFAFSNYDHRQVVAVLLHEIGHSFFMDKTYMEGYYRPVGMLVGFYRKLVYQLPHIKRSSGSDFWRLIFRDSSEDYDISLGDEKQNSLVKDFYATLGNALNIGYSIAQLPYFAYTIVNTFFFPDYKLATYKAEKFADSFATRYGYGVDSANVEKWLGSNIKNDDSPATHFKIVMKVLVSYVYTFLAPHPHTYIRIKDQLDYLRKETKNPSLNSELRKRLASDIARLEKIVEEEEEYMRKNDAYEVIKRINKFLFGKAVIEWRELFVKNEAGKVIDRYENRFAEYLKEHFDVDYKRGVVYSLDEDGVYRVPWSEDVIVPLEQRRLGVEFVSPSDCRGYLQEGIFDQLGAKIKSAASNTSKLIKDALYTAEKIGDDAVEVSANAVDASANVKQAVADGKVISNDIKTSVDHLTSPETLKTVNSIENVTKNIRDAAVSLDSAADKTQKTIDDLGNKAEKIKKSTKERIEYAKRNAYILTGASIIGTAMSQAAFYNHNMLLNACSDYIKQSRGMMMLATASSNSDDEVVPEVERNKIKLVMRFVIEGMVLVLIASLTSALMAALAINVWIGVLFAVAIPMITAWSRVSDQTEVMAAKLDAEILELNRFMRSSEFKKLSKTQKAAITNFTSNLVKLRMRLG